MNKLITPRKCFYIFAFLLLPGILLGDSGGILMPQQAAYDVKFYDLSLAIQPSVQKISGSLLVRAEIVDALDSLVLDLDERLSVDSVLLKKDHGNFENVFFTFSSGKIYIPFSETVPAGIHISARIHYQGQPRISNHPPWDPGFVWRRTPSNKHWIGVACETEGADIWWPCKDHPSDEPDSMALHFTVPEPYGCISNGQFTGSQDNGDGTTTFHWFVSTPINNYNVTLYISEYNRIEDHYFSVSGDSIPFYFWVLPESHDQAVTHLPVFLSEFQFLESVCGPFPFAGDKHGWAHAPYWGMEHQTVIAYGNDFQVNSWGLDYIHFHELAHEWWGNLITAADWSDVWIHEGLATYMEALYVEKLSGPERYHQYMNNRKPDNTHSYPLAPRTSMTASNAFDHLNPYWRGSWVMHTLRYYLGDEQFFNLLRHWAYADTADTDNRDGRLCRLVTTDDMKEAAEHLTGRDLNSFFEVFFREISYPYLKVEVFPNEAIFSWITEGGIPLDLNVPVTVNGESRTVEMIAGTGNLSLSHAADLQIDPERWILMSPPAITDIGDQLSSQTPKDFQLYQNYPNPFNPVTVISWQLPAGSRVNLDIYNSAGQKVAVLINGRQPAGFHSIEFDASHLASGIYYYRLQAGDYVKTRKMVLMQ